MYLQVTWRTAYSQERNKNITEVAPTRLRQSRYYIEVSRYYTVIYTVLYRLVAIYRGQLMLHRRGQ